MKNTEILPFEVDENLVDELGISVDELKKFETEIKQQLPIPYFNMMVKHGLMDDMLMVMKELRVPANKIIPLIRGFMNDVIIPALLQEAVEIEVPFGLDVELVKILEQLGIKMSQLASLQKEIVLEIGAANFNKWLKTGRIYKIIDRGVDRNLVGLRLLRFIEDNVWDEIYDIFGESKKDDNVNKKIM